MSFLLDVADPSIHFRARQYCNSTGSKVAPTVGETATPSPLSSRSSSSSLESPLTPFHSSYSSKHSLFSSVLPSTKTTTTATTKPVGANNNTSDSLSLQMPMPQIAMPKPTTSITMPMPMNSSGPHNAFSAMSRMIRTASSSSSIPPPSNLPSRSTTPILFSSRPTTPDVSNVLDPFLTTSNLSAAATTTTTNGTNHGSSGSRIATSLSPWMKPSVCDDDQMNKLVSFQL